MSHSHVGRNAPAIGHLHPLLLLQHAHPLAQNVGLLRLAHLAEQLKVDGDKPARSPTTQRYTSGNWRRTIQTADTATMTGWLAGYSRNEMRWRIRSGS